MLVDARRRGSWNVPSSLRAALRGGLALGLLGSLCGCGSDPSPEGAGGEDVQPHFDYPLDDVLRLQHLQTKGTHNSYHLEKPGNTVEDWHYSHAPLAVQLGESGVRAVELDTHYDEAADVFRVYHLPALDEASTCELFVDCLRELKAWSDAHRAHHTLFIHVEPKSGFPTPDPEDYFRSFEAEVRSVWPEQRLVTPAMVRGDSASLGAALAERGFPTLGETRGRALFYFDDHADVRDAYTRGGTSIEGRLAFVDSAPGDPFGAVAVLNDPVGDAAAISAAFAAGFLVRTRADASPGAAYAGDTAQRDAALASGAQIVTTDFPAPVTGLDYFVTVPDGTPSRCNPVTAPAECTALAIEDPLFVGP
jgi:hypothetical protein